MVNLFSLHEPPNFLNLSHILSNNWTLSTPAHYTIIGDGLASLSLPRGWSDVTGAKDFVHVIIIIWMTLLTIKLLYLLFEVCIVSGMISFEVLEMDYPQF